MDTRVRVWDVRKKGCIYSYKGHTGKVNALLFSPDGKWLSSGGDDGSVKIWELSSGRLIQDFSLHTGPVTSLQYHPNELLLASGSMDRTAKFWDLEQFGVVDGSQPEATGVRQIKFHPDGACLFSGNYYGNFPLKNSFNYCVLARARFTRVSPHPWLGALAMLRDGASGLGQVG